MKVMRRLRNGLNGVSQKGKCKALPRLRGRGARMHGMTAVSSAEGIAKELKGARWLADSEIHFPTYMKAQDTVDQLWNSALEPT